MDESKIMNRATFWICISSALLLIIVNCYFHQKHEEKVDRIIVGGFKLNNKILILETKVFNLEKLSNKLKK